MSRTAVRIFFNFRSPYCYLASHSLLPRLAAFDIDILWRSLGGWDGRSPPERAKVKVPLTRQDVARWCRRMQVPFNPPPISTDPTPAALVAFAAEDAGLLAHYVQSVSGANGRKVKTSVRPQYWKAWPPTSASRKLQYVAHSTISPFSRACTRTGGRRSRWV